MDSNGFSRIIYGGQPHAWLIEYLEYSQKMSAYPFRFFSSEDEAKVKAANTNDYDSVLGDMNEERTGILKNLKANMSVEHYFGQDSGDEKSDMHRMATFWNSARPPWIRMWTIIQQHKREKDDFGTIVEGEEVFRRTYVLGNNIFSDYGFGTLQDFMTTTSPGTRGYAVDQFYRNSPELNTDPYSQDFTMINKGMEYNQITPEQNAGVSDRFAPAARIKDVTMSVKGVRMGATSITTVTFDVWNKADFYNIYQRFFLTPGAQIVLDIGRTDIEPYDIKELVDLNNLNSVTQYDSGELDSKIRELRFGYGDHAGKQNPCNSNTIVGTVTKFDSKVKHDKFECSVTLVSKNRISLAASMTMMAGTEKISEKFINRIDTFAILSTIEHILPIEKVKEIWNVNWLDSRKIDEIVAIIGNSVLSSQYATVVQKDGDEGENSQEGDTLDDSGNKVLRHIKIGDKAIPLVYIPKSSQDRGVYVQRLAYSYKDNKLKQVTSSPKLKNNVFVSLHWLENELFNPILDSEYYGDNKNKKENKIGQFKTPILNQTSVSTPLFRQQLYSNKIAHSLTWLYGSDCNNGGWDDPKSINEKCIIKNLFVNCDVVKRALSAKDKIKDVYQFILEAINTDSNGLYDFVLAPITETGTDLQIIDMNFESEGIVTIAKSYIDTAKTELEYETNELTTWNSKPTLRPFTPGSVILNMDLGFNVANNKLASMMAIQGGGSNHRFSINNYKSMNQFGQLTNLREMGDAGYGWKYLPETKTTWEDNATQNKNDFFTWHSHIPDIGSGDSTFNRMRNYQGFGAEGHDKLIEISKNKKKYEYNTNSYDKLDEKEREKLDKTVGVLQKDVIKEREKEWKLESSKLQQEVVEDDSGGTFRWIFAKDWYDYYRLKHIKAMHNDNPTGTEDTMPRYNPPITGMKLTLSLNGMFGWKIGDSFKLDELPPEYQNKVYFVVTAVSHRFGTSGWTTDLECSYRLRPGLKYSVDFDFTSTVMTNTKIGISKTFLQTLGFSESTAEEFSKWDDTSDIHHALTKDGGISTQAEYKVELKEFKDSKKGQEIIDSFDEDGAVDEDLFSTSITVVVDDEAQINRQIDMINSRGISKDIINFQPITQIHHVPVAESTGGVHNNSMFIVEHIDREKHINQIFKEFEVSNPISTFDIDYNFDFNNSDPFSTANANSEIRQLNNSMINIEDAFFAGNHLVNLNASQNDASNIQRITWNVSNSALTSIDKANGVSFDTVKNDSLLYQDFGGDYNQIKKQINEYTNGAGLSVDQNFVDSQLSGQFKDLGGNAQVVYVDTKGDTLHVSKIDVDDIDMITTKNLEDLFVKGYYSNGAIDSSYNQVDSEEWMKKFVLGGDTPEHTLDFVPSENFDVSKYENFDLTSDKFPLISKVIEKNEKNKKTVVKEDNRQGYEKAEDGFCFIKGTQIHMFDGSKKNIEDVQVGDEVLSMKNIKGIVTEHLIHSVNKNTMVAKVGNLMGEPHHPIFENDKWIEMKKSNDVTFEQKYVDNYYNLEIDGDDVYGSEHNYIANNQIVSGLGDNEILNDIYQRQNIFKKEFV